MKRILGAVLMLGLVGCSKGMAPQAKAETPAQLVKPGKIEVIDLEKNVKLEMVLIPAGKFIMGSKGREKKEPQHEVTLTKQYYMGKYEVTQEQWEAVMGNDPRRNKGENMPITNVSWNDCQEFIKKLNDKTTGGFRLPTEAEWEYSCRAGTTTSYSFGDNITPKEANYSGSKIDKPVAVGSYQPNAFGLYDMHGNVWEWCNDWFADYDLKENKDPQGVSSGERKVVRGGSFFLNESFSRSFTRGDGDAPTIRNNYDGLRLVRSN